MKYVYDRKDLINEALLNQARFEKERNEFNMIAEKLKQEIAEDIKKGVIPFQTFMNIFGNVTFETVIFKYRLYLFNREKRRKLNDIGSEAYYQLLKKQIENEEKIQREKLDDIFEKIGISFEFYEKIKSQLISKAPILRETFDDICNEAKFITTINPHEPLAIDDAKRIMEFMIEQYDSIEIPEYFNPKDRIRAKRYVVFDLADKEFNGFQEEYIKKTETLSKDKDLQNLISQFNTKVQKYALSIK